MAPRCGAARERQDDGRQSNVIGISLCTALVDYPTKKTFHATRVISLFAISTSLTGCLTRRVGPAPVTWPRSRVRTPARHAIRTGPGTVTSTTFALRNARSRVSGTHVGRSAMVHRQTITGTGGCTVAHLADSQGLQRPRGTVGSRAPCLGRGPGCLSRAELHDVIEPGVGTPPRARRAASAAGPRGTRPAPGDAPRDLS
jgi:hypothetical protein